MNFDRLPTWKFSPACNTYVEEYIQENVIPGTNQQAVKLAKKTVYNRVERIINSIYVELVLIHRLPLANKVDNTLTNPKQKPILLDKKEVDLIQNVVNELFNTNLRIESLDSRGSFVQSYLHPTLFPSTEKFYCRFSGEIDKNADILKSSAQKTIKREDKRLPEYLEDPHDVLYSRL